MFVAEKVLQEIVYLLKLNHGRMHLIKMMKELYLIDRLSIQERDTSVSGDAFFSMQHGPVLSFTLNMLRDISKNQWGDNLEAIKTRDYYPDISLTNDLECDLLSEKEKDYIRSVSVQFYEYSPAEIEEFTHSLEEWSDPQLSSKKIKFADIMRALGKTDEEIIEAKKEYDFLETLTDLGSK